MELSIHPAPQYNHASSGTFRDQVETTTTFPGRLLQTHHFGKSRVAVAHQDQTLQPDLNAEEFGVGRDARNVVILQPQDEGFGAWSYVASAFAMYIVVWGIKTCLEKEASVLMLRRLS